MPAQHVKASERVHEDTSPAKIDATSKFPVGDMSVVTLRRTDISLDHSQRTEFAGFAKTYVHRHYPCVRLPFDAAGPYRFSMRYALSAISQAIGQSQAPMLFFVFVKMFAAFSSCVEAAMLWVPIAYEIERICI